ncbi:MAG: Stp1/IreP family PP2C-type Ser/Thr phosphatase [Gemmatimonadaceae bacterium]|nr:Stp1/IreP family PP2C-type Ser/Thr phosphatase [Gemmatimonadaceae bacterium]
MQLTHAANTHVGMVRSGNEDALHAEADAVRGLYMVADGMGGHAAGEVASAMAIELIIGSLRRAAAQPIHDLGAVLTEAVREANRAIYQRTLEETDKQGMGTTATALVVGQGEWIIGHVGDSRVYLLRDGTLTQLTRDHSYVQEQVDAGYLTPEQAKYHPFSNVITRCVGVAQDVVPDVLRGDLQAGDTFLLATDGLTGMVDDPVLQRILLQRPSPGPMVDSLIREANRAGGVDNVSAVIVKIIAP